LYNKFKNRGLSIVAIDNFGDTEGAQRFFKENTLTFTLLEDGDEDVVYNTFGIVMHPTSLLVDERGRIMYHHLGFREGDEKKYEEEILSLLGVD
jgi:peroxiredoxin